MPVLKKSNCVKWIVIPHFLRYLFTDIIIQFFTFNFVCFKTYVLLRTLFYGQSTLKLNKINCFFNKKWNLTTILWLLKIEYTWKIHRTTLTAVRCIFYFTHIFNIMSFWTCFRISCFRDPEINSGWH